MTALILNSGNGTRMGDATSLKPKCMTELLNDETILSRQLKMLCLRGISNIVITTGKYDELIQEYCYSLKLDANFIYVKNPMYDTTNYIYSMYLASEVINEDVFLMHGDLIFSNEALDTVLSESGSCMAVSSLLPLPDKDFKAVIDEKGRIKKIGVEFFKGVIAAQPLYKLDKRAISAWFSIISKYCKNGNVNCYAENALNEILNNIHISPCDVKMDLCMEIDTPYDLYEARARLRQTQIYSLNELADKIDKYKKVFAVHGRAYDHIKNVLKNDVVEFTEFSTNPKYEESTLAVERFTSQCCDVILAVGGGSAIDTAKCVKHLSGSKVPVIAIPTTAGTGSEATHFAVVYQNGEKLSVSGDEVLPEYFALIPELLNTVPEYTMVCNFMDMLCHAIESMWSKKSNDESKYWAIKALEILKNGIDIPLKQKQLAAYYAGCAINISETTAAHAMCYKLTSLFNIAHGHAAAICLIFVWEHVLEFNNYFGKEIADIYGYRSSKEYIAFLRGLFIKKGLAIPSGILKRIDELTESVNYQRLINFPYAMTSVEIRKIYLEMTK